MQTSEIRAAFRRVYNGKQNFLTPTIVDFGKRGAHLFEISTGTGINRQPIYGVTVITVRGDKCPDHNGCFDSLEAAYAHARALPRAATVQQ